MGVRAAQDRRREPCWPPARRRGTCPEPVMNRGSSLRRSGAPMAPVEPTAIGRAPQLAAGVVGAGSPSRIGPAAAITASHDVVVAGATAVVALDGVAHLGLVRVRVACQQVGRAHDHARCAEAALQAVVVPERLLERMQPAFGGQALDGRDGRAVRLDRQDRARLHGCPSTWTVQAPHWLVSQPTWVPVRPRSSRSSWTSSRRGSTSTVLGPR